MAELRRLAQQTQRLVDIAHRQIRDADQALAVGAAEIPEPAVVSLEARDVELAVGGAERTAAEPHRRVDAVDRESVVEGKRVSVRVGLGGGRIIKKKKKNMHTRRPEKV